MPKNVLFLLKNRKNRRALAGLCPQTLKIAPNDEFLSMCLAVTFNL